MRILYHHRTSGEEPESVHISNIVAALRSFGHTVDVLGPSGLEHGRGETQRSKLGGVKDTMPRVIVELVQIAFNLKSLWLLMRTLGGNRYDFIYERYALYNVAGLVASRLHRLPLILEVNTPYAQAWAKYFGLRFERFARVVERFLFRRADHIITVTDVQRRLLEAEGVPSERITVCHNAIDPAVFSMDRFQGDSLPRELGLRPVVVGFVGTMNRWQGVERFSDVVREVAASRDDVTFLFVGEGEGRAALAAEIERLNLSPYVVFLGRRAHETIPRFVAAMTIGLLLDSNAYGSPMKIFEYWSMSKAVIAPRVPPVLEIMQDGLTGILIDPGDAAAMAREILRLCADPELCSRLGASGRTHVLMTHTWTQNAQGILDAYMKVKSQQQRVQTE